MEAPETVVLTLDPPGTFVAGPNASATVTIAEDPAVVAVVATDPDASEAGLFWRAIRPRPP